MDKIDVNNFGVWRAEIIAPGVWRQGKFGNHFLKANSDRSEIDPSWMDLILWIFLLSSELLFSKLNNRKVAIARAIFYTCVRDFFLLSFWRIHERLHDVFLLTLNSSVRKSWNFLFMPCLRMILKKKNTYSCLNHYFHYSKMSRALLFSLELPCWNEVENCYI